jgi:fructokinase
MAETSFLVIGEALVDLISDSGTWRFEATPGGSPLNVAVALAAAGHPVRFATELGDDLFARLIRSYLDHYHVAPTDLATVKESTNLAFAQLMAAGVAGYDFRFRWTWRGQPELDGVGCLHMGSLAAVVEPGATAVRETVAAARKRGIPISYDPNVRPALMSQDPAAQVERLVAEADIVKASSDDVARLYPGTPEREAATRWLRLGPRLVVITRGGDGALAVTEECEVEHPALQVKVVDTVGAGDAFMAGLLSSLAVSGELAGPTLLPLKAAMRSATEAAAAVVTQRGAGPVVPSPYRDPGPLPGTP